MAYASIRARALALAGLSLIWLLSISREGVGAEAPPTEYQIKAAFIFNFAKFVEWPPKAVGQPKSPIVIGILGENPFRDSLEQTIHGKTVEEHPLVVQEFRSLTEVTNCHILFISSSMKTQLTMILKELKGKSVLSVGEMDDFTKSGGMINFVMEGTKIRFRINNEAATSAGLKISSKLISLSLPAGP